MDQASTRVRARRAVLARKAAMRSAAMREPLVPTLTLRTALPTVRLKLWDETTGRLVTFREARVFECRGSDIKR